MKRLQRTASRLTRLLPVLALLLVAATPPDELREYRVAQAAFESKLYDVAERLLREFIQAHPKSDRADNAQYLLGQTELNLGKWEAAVQTLQESLALWPDTRPDGIHLWLGEAFSRGGKFPEAEAQYLIVIDKFPRSPHVSQALYGLAFVQLKAEQFTAASETLDRLAKAKPREELALEGDLLRGQLRLAQGDFAKAETALEAVAQKAPDTRAYYRAQLWLGESFARRKEFTNALTRYALVTDAFQQKPNKPVDGQLAAEAWYGAGWTQWQMEKFGDATTSFNAALTNATIPDLKRDALLKLAEASVRDGKVSDGVAHLKDFLAVHPTDPLADSVQLAIGDLLAGNGEPATALVEYGILVRLYPNSLHLSRAYRQAGWCAWQLKKPGDALLFFQQALPLAKDPAEIMAKIGDAQFALGLMNDAIATYQLLIGTYPQAANLDRALFQLGEAYRQLHNSEGATTAYESLVRDYPQSELAPQAQYSLGQLQSTAGHEPAARAAYALVMTNFPSSVWASNAALAVGESFTREGEYDKAIAEFNKLIGPGLDNELAQQAYYSRGWCYAMTGKRDKTLSEFLEFMKARPQAPLAPRIQYWVADEYLRQRDYLKAQAQFQTLSETYTNYVDADAALYFAGRAAYARQDYTTAISLYEQLVKRFPQSNWRCEARFGQGDASSELGRHDDALLVFESLIKDFPDCTLAAEAWGRKGDCQYTLSRYDDALVSYRKALDTAKDSAIRSQALFKLGETSKALKKNDEALQFYTKALLESAVAPEPNEPPERFWSCKAAREAATIKEQQYQWREAITLYERMAELCPDLKALAEDRVRKLRVLHPETLFSK